MLRSTRYATFRVLHQEAPGELSVYGGGGTPGPIPNPAVKPSIAEGTTAEGRGRLGRC